MAVQRVFCVFCVFCVSPFSYAWRVAYWRATCCYMLLHAATCCYMLLHAATRSPRRRLRCRLRCPLTRVPALRMRTSKANSRMVLCVGG